MKTLLIALAVLLACPAPARAEVETCYISYCGASGGCTTGATWAQCRQWPAEGHDYHGLAGGYDMSEAEGAAYMHVYCSSWGGVLMQSSNCGGLGVQNADLHACGWD
jgi:hypothetical protein